MIEYFYLNVDQQVLRVAEDSGKPVNAIISSFQDQI